MWGTWHRTVEWGGREEVEGREGGGGGEDKATYAVVTMEMNLTVISH